MGIAAVRIVRRSEFVEMPWKNGGGVTHEAIRVPPDAHPFAWRVSLARIDESGPFSEFAGYSRSMVLLSGKGIELDFAGRQRSLEKIGELIEFDGELAPHCRLLDGPCVDLNLMVAKRFSVTSRVERFGAPFDIPDPLGGSTLIVGIDDSIQLQAGAEEPLDLDPWDLVILSNSSGRLSRREPGSRAFASVFIATITQ